MNYVLPLCYPSFIPNIIILCMPPFQSYHYTWQYTVFTPPCSNLIFTYPWHNGFPSCSHEFEDEVQQILSGYFDEIQEEIVTVSVCMTVMKIVFIFQT